MNIKEAVLLSVFTSMIVILNHVRQIVNYKNQERLLFIESIINNGVSIVIGSNLKGEITYISENVSTILGYSPDELMGNGWWLKTIDSNTEIENEKNKIIENFKKEEITTRLIKTKNGEYRWIQWHDKKFSENLIIGIGQDVTDLKNLEFEKQIRQEKLLNQQNCISEINKLHLDGTADIQDLINQILQIALKGLNIDIISLLEYENQKMQVIYIKHPAFKFYNQSTIVDLKKYPIYSNVLLKGNPIVANNVLVNEDTKEFINGYFKENEIKSLVDFPINIGGELKFILSCETINEYRNWDNDDINFIRNIADFVSLNLENQKRKLAEKHVFESESIFRQINETIDNVFWLYNLVDNKVIYISPSCNKILGATQENFYSTFDYWTKYIFDEDRPYILEQHRKIKTQGYYEIEYRINKNGEIRWIKEKSYAIQDENGNVVKSSGICTDITAEKIIEIELKQLSLIAEKTTNGVSISDIEGYVLWVNQAYLDLFEIEKTEIIGKKPRDLFVKNKPELIELFNEINGSNYKFEFEAITGKNNKIWIEINNTVISNENGKFIQQVDVLRNITTEVLAKQKIQSQSLILEEYAKDLEYQNKLKEKLIHADHLEDVCFNSLTFIEDQFENTHHISMVFPDVNETYFSGFKLINNLLEEDVFYASELNCLEKAKNGEIYFKEDITKITDKSLSDEKYFELGIKSYIVIPFYFQNSFLGILIIGFDKVLELSFKQITYLKEACSVISVTINQLNLKDNLQTKNDDILASILYAKNIQNSALPDLKTLSKSIENVTLFYRPKDIVSGDFYWGKDTEDYCYIALGDCTGHGVPGAFLTLLGINILEQLIGIEKKTSPAEVLTLLDQRLYASLNQNMQESIIDDGMELGLCVFNKKQKTIQFAGAGLGILYFYQNEEIHIRGQRTSIGEKKEKGFVFENNDLAITGKEFFYMATDGYQDQLGGPRYKRFSKNRLISLLNEIKFKEAEDQEKILLKNIDEYIGNYSQLDDFTILGFTITT